MKTCEVDGCERPVIARAKCQAHWKRWRKTGDPQADRPVRLLRSRGSCSLRDEQGRKLCPSCGNWLPETEFGLNSRAPDRRKNHCRRCAKNAMLQRQFGMTIEEYEHLLGKQNGACAICRRTDRRFVVDHDRRCCAGEFSCGMCVRGVLCGNCNTAIGLLEENPVVFAAALKYIGVAEEV